MKKRLMILAFILAGFESTALLAEQIPSEGQAEALEALSIDNLEASMDNYTRSVQKVRDRANTLSQKVQQEIETAKTEISGKGLEEFITSQESLSDSTKIKEMFKTLRTREDCTPEVEKKVIIYFLYQKFQGMENLIKAALGRGSIDRTDGTLAGEDYSGKGFFTRAMEKLITTLQNKNVNIVSGEEVTKYEDMLILQHHKTIIQFLSNEENIEKAIQKIATLFEGYEAETDKAINKAEAELSGREEAVSSEEKKHRFDIRSIRTWFGKVAGKFAKILEQKQPASPNAATAEEELSQPSINYTTVEEGIKAVTQAFNFFENQRRDQAIRAWREIHPNLSGDAQKRVRDIFKEVLLEKKIYPKKYKLLLGKKVPTPPQPTLFSTWKKKTTKVIRKDKSNRKALAKGKMIPADVDTYKNTQLQPLITEMQGIKKDMDQAYNEGIRGLFINAIQEASADKQEALKKAQAAFEQELTGGATSAPTTITEEAPKAEEEEKENIAAEDTEGEEGEETVEKETEKESNVGEAEEGDTETEEAESVEETAEETVETEDKDTEEESETEEGESNVSEETNPEKTEKLKPAEDVSGSEGEEVVSA